MIDIFADLNDGVSLKHILHEVALFVLALGAVIWQIKVILGKDAYIQTLNAELV